MKKIKLLLIALTAIMSMQSVTAQTVDEIIDLNLKAMGGKEKLASLNTVKMTGSLNTQGNEISLVITRKQMVGSRADISVMGSENYMIVTPTKGWSFMPVQGMTAPDEMPEQQLQSSQTQLDIQSPLLNYKEKGNTVEFLGKEKVDDDDCYKLKVVYKNGTTTIFFISGKDNRLIKSSGKRNMNGQDVDFDSRYTNYKQNADGYWFAYTISSTIQGETNFDKIDTNMPVDEKIFKTN